MTRYKCRKCGGEKLTKIDAKWPSYKFVKNRPKSAKKLICHGGVKIVQNRRRGPRTPKTEFFEISHFFAKTCTFRTPKSTPKMGPYRKCHSPQKRLYFCSNGGVKNVTFWGVGGRTARTEKCRHYYIAKIGFGGSNFDEIYRFSTPATSARYR
jgi:hypothetical protein